MSNGKVEELTKPQFNKVTDKSRVVIDFYHEWKMPCIMMSPLIDQIAKKFEGVDFCRVNMEECQELANKHNVLSTPTVIVFKNGEEVDRITEALGLEQLEERLSSLLK